MSEMPDSKNHQSDPISAFEWIFRILFIGGIIGMILGIGFRHQPILVISTLATLLAIGLSFINQRQRQSRRTEFRDDDV